ncbi:MAG: hypothetical protein U1F41_04460 [Burkholderiales bacterium]
MLDAVAMLVNYVAVALEAVNSIGMVIAIAITAAILASIGGMIDARMRLYGAIVGGMIMNIVVKAEGGSYAAALAAMVLISGLAFGLGSLSFLVQVLRGVRRKVS